MAFRNDFEKCLHWGRACSQWGGGLLESHNFFQDLCFQIHAFSPPPPHSHNPFDRLRKDGGIIIWTKAFWMIHSFPDFVAHCNHVGTFKHPSGAQVLPNAN